MRSLSVLRRAALLMVMCAPGLAAQGAVAGQVTLIERPGESSEDPFCDCSHLGWILVMK